MANLVSANRAAAVGAEREDGRAARNATAAKPKGISPGPRRKPAASHKRDDRRAVPRKTNAAGRNGSGRRRCHAARLSPGWRGRS